MTNIEWTDETWNPVRGCRRVSPGCGNCYAERHAWRFSGPGQPYDGLVQLKSGRPTWTGQAVFIKEQLTKPLGWRAPRKVFVNSMSDLFHSSLHYRDVDAIHAVMAATPRHTYQVLTKRPLAMRSYYRLFEKRVGQVAEIPRVLAVLMELSRAVREFGISIPSVGWPLDNLWLGVSVENQNRYDERVPLLMDTPAAVRFLSVEPLLDPVKLDLAAHPVDWVIVGGESGPGARPMDADWVRSIRDQCVDAGVPFFFKQWGGTNKKLAGRELDGTTWTKMPETGQLRLV